jgi:hypothetical protein
MPGGRQVDPAALASAIVRQVESGDLDFRTRLLIRDSLEALAGYWGENRLSTWLDRSATGEQIRRIRQEDLGAPGFPSLRWRVMDPTRAETILEFLEELGAKAPAPARLFIGGSAALIVPRMLVRSTDDIDVVDELPPALRGEHALLNDLASRYGLRLAHFQSHYLPHGWQSRVRSLGKFGALETFLLDPYDVCVSKLFSQRTKDLDDLRHLKPQLEKHRLLRHLQDHAHALRAEEKLLHAAEMNWRILFSEPLPS